MENRRTKLTHFNKRFAFIGVLLALALSGCQTVQMPDLSDFDLGLSRPVNLVTIKHQYDRINIRPTPSTSKSPIGSLKGGDQVNMLSENQGWLNVSFYDTAGNEQDGWVYKYLVIGYDKPPAMEMESKPAMRPELDADDEPVEERPAADISIL